MIVLTKCAKTPENGLNERQKREKKRFMHIKEEF